MRAALLAVFGGLMFLLALTLAQASLGLDSPQMRWGLLPFLGAEPAQRYAPGGSPCDWLAYAVAFATTGVLCWRFVRLLYGRHA